MQPVQIRYFDKSGAPIFKMVNCNIDPPLPMTWNKHKSFDTFPPTQLEEYKHFPQDSFHFFLPFIKTLNGDTVTLESIPESDYYAIAFLNSFYIKPSKNLFRQLKKYEKKHAEKGTFILYVNNHNAKIWGYLNFEQKEQVANTGTLK